MQNANTLYYSVSMQSNKQALFIAFSFAQPKLTVSQRIAHAVITCDKKLTTAKLAQIVAGQAKFDKAACTRECNNTSIAKLLRKNDSPVAQQVNYYC